MNSENLVKLYDGLVDEFRMDGAVVIESFCNKRIERWKRLPDFGGSLDIAFLLDRGIILRKADKRIGLVLGTPDTGSFLTPEEMCFGGILSSEDSLRGDLNYLRRVVKGDNWVFGRFYDSHEGVGIDCWANESAFGGGDTKSVDIDSAWEIINRTIEHGFKK